MPDEKNDNLNGDVASETMDDDYLPPDARPLCPKCLQPCDPLQYYCTNCGSNEAINPLASYMPYLRIRFAVGLVGKLYHRARDSKAPLILRILFWIILITWLLSLSH